MRPSEWIIAKAFEISKQSNDQTRDEHQDSALAAVIAYLDIEWEKNNKI